MLSEYINASPSLPFLNLRHKVTHLQTVVFFNVFPPYFPWYSWISSSLDCKKTISWIFLLESNINGVYLSPGFLGPLSQIYI